MSVQTVVLSDGGATGIAPQFISTREPLPLTVKLGRNPIKPGQQALRFRSFYSPANMTAPPPASINRRDKAAASLARMYLNDRYGCCVFSGKAHMFGVMSANDSDSGGIVHATDAEIQKQYFDYTGGRDTGANIQEVLGNIKQRGFLMGGKRYGIDGFVRADNTNRLETQVAQYIFGATSIGFMLPKEWASSAIWKPTNSQIVGGHDVTPIDYDSEGVYVSSWGRVYLITWEAWQSQRWIQEYWISLAPLWYGNDKLAPSGFNTGKLQEALGQIDNGITPDPTPPAPPTPPSPPVPPKPPVVPPVPPSPEPPPGQYIRTVTIRSASPVQVEIR